jgi:photosystem II stability/assembly factor-like uncharacterized protein
MTKWALGFTGALGLLLAAALCTVVAVRGVAVRGLSMRGVYVRGVRREFSRSMVRRAWQAFHTSILTATHAASATSQEVVPRAPDFLQPQRLDAWQIIGPGGGGAFYYPSISPHDPNLVFATTDMTACYVSENGGRTWRTFNLRFSCRFVFDPKLPNRVYALSTGLWRSDDRGHTWSMIYPDASRVGYVDDEAEAYLQSSVGYPLAVAAMAVDPDDSNTLYTSVAEEAMLVSKDAGKTWKTLAPDAYATQLWVDPTSPRGKRTIYTRRNNLIGTWDGSKYVKRAIEGGVGDVNGGAFGTPSAGGKPVLYVASDYVIKDGEQKGGGIMATDDGGQTWRSLNENLLKLVAKGTFPNFTTIAASRNHAEIIYASFTNFISADDKKPYYGILKSSDGGATWAAIRQESSVTAANMHNDWTSSRYGPDFGDEPMSIGVDDNNPDLVYTSDLARVMRSVDGGKNWFGVNSQSTGKGYTTTGLDVTTCYGIHFDPFDPKRVFISYTDIGLMRSEDGGESWLSATTASTGVPRAWENTTYWVEFDPAVKGKMWAVMSARHDLPRQRMLNLWGGGPGGVVASVDGGNTWKTSTQGLPSIMVPTHILLDPKSPVEARVLYLTVFGQGIFKSTDGGQSWTPKNTGLPEQYPFTWRMAIGSDGALYVVTIRRSQDGKYGNDQDGWLFRSRNGAESWERVPLPEGVNGPMGITVDPRDPARLYLSAWARYTLYGAGVLPPDGGVYMSADGGRRWQNVLNSSRRIYDVTVDPRNSDLVYAGGFEGSAWRSADRGKTWSRLGGFNFKDGHRVIPDPTDINKIYITTFGNSVWHGPATGDPKALEDITAPAFMRFQSAWSVWK